MSAPHPPRAVVRVLSPLKDFLKLEAAGAMLLAGAAFLALVWANSPWSDTYEDLWQSRLAISLSSHAIDLELRHWINDGLMTVFFLVVGLEINRELTDGHLSNRRAALLPAAAAVGGMVTPAIVYLAIAGQDTPRGWAIPIATDIALAVGVLAVVGSRLPASLRALMLGLAIVDDIGAILIIAAVYSTGIGWGWLALAVGAAVLVRVLCRMAVTRTWVYVVIGAGMWYALFRGGVHPTIAGVALGLLAPTSPRLTVDLIDDDELVDLSSADHAIASSEIARGSVSVVEWLQHVLHPWTSYVVVPLFALANSGIPVSIDDLRDAAGSPITWGVLCGLVIGKPLGVVVAARLAARAGIADLPDDARPGQLLGIGAAAGIGFTVALFITELALEDPVDRQHTKIAILAASILAATFGALVLRRASAGDDPSAPAS